MKKMKPRVISEIADERGITVVVGWRMPNLLTLTTEYLFRPDGTVNLFMRVRSFVNLIRFGFKFALSDGIEDMEFYGKGPHENYIDRNVSALLGRYKGKAEDFIHDYLHPQENGNHTGMRSLKITDAGGFGVAVEKCGRPFEASVHPYTVEMLENAKHANELGRLPNLRVYVDGGQRGVGGDIPAIALLKKPYKLLRFKEHVFSVELNITEG
jgi:beta-galactosidase